jgi:hypothetical protein
MAMGATSCASWSFWPRMRCAKGGYAHHRRGNPVQPRSPDGGSGGKLVHCVALLENPIGTRAENYLTNGNRLLLDLFNVQVEMV